MATARFVGAVIVGLAVSVGLQGCGSSTTTTTPKKVGPTSTVTSTSTISSTTTTTSTAVPPVEPEFECKVSDTDTEFATCQEWQKYGKHNVLSFESYKSDGTTPLQAYYTVEYATGPVWDDLFREWVFSDLTASKSYRVSTQAKQIWQWNAPAKQYNGKVYDPEAFKLYAADMGHGGNRGAIVELADTFEVDRQVAEEVLVDEYNGKWFNSPCQIAFGKSRSELYFTDPKAESGARNELDEQVYLVKRDWVNPADTEIHAFNLTDGGNIPAYVPYGIASWNSDEKFHLYVGTNKGVDVKVYTTTTTSGEDTIESGTFYTHQAPGGLTLDAEVRGMTVVPTTGHVLICTESGVSVVNQAKTLVGVMKIDVGCDDIALGGNFTPPEVPQVMITSQGRVWLLAVPGTDGLLMV